MNSNNFQNFKKESILINISFIFSNYQKYILYYLCKLFKQLNPLKGYLKLIQLTQLEAISTWLLGIKSILAHLQDLRIEMYYQK